MAIFIATYFVINFIYLKWSRNQSSNVNPVDTERKNKAIFYVKGRRDVVLT